MPEEKIFVGPFKVKRVSQRFPYTRVAEYLAAGVHRERLHAGRAAMFYGFSFNLAGVKLVTGVGGGPVLGRGLYPKIEITGTEGLQGDGVILVVVIVNFIEVIPPFSHSDVPGPVILHPFEGDGAARLEVANAIRATANGRCQTVVAKFTIFPVMTWKNGQLAKNQWQFTVVGVTKLEADSPLIFDDYLGHVCIIVAIERMAFGGQNIERKLHVLRGNGFTILEPGFITQMKGHVTAVFRGFNRLGNQAIRGKGFVRRRFHQRIV